MDSLIIDKWTLEQKVIRLAYEILEEHNEENELCLVGVKNGGFKTANLIKQAILHIKSDYNASVHSLSLNKDAPLSEPIKISTDIDYFNNKVCVLVDDVANSGRTLFYAFTNFMHIEPKSIKVAVLVDRTHKKFPVNCNYVGTSLATTIKEHIKVVFENDVLEAAYLV